MKMGFLCSHKWLLDLSMSSEVAIGKSREK